MLEWTKVKNFDFVVFASHDNSVFVKCHACDLLRRAFESLNTLVICHTPVFDETVFTAGNHHAMS